VSVLSWVFDVRQLDCVGVVSLGLFGESESGFVARPRRVVLDIAVRRQQRGLGRSVDVDVCWDRQCETFTWPLECGRVQVIVAPRVASLDVAFLSSATTTLTRPTARSGVTPFDLPGLYETIREKRPETLISDTDGVTGTEDFVAPELYYDSHREELDKSGEVCACMLPAEEYEDEIRHSGGYLRAADGKHKTEAEVWELLRETHSKGYTLLLNTGPLPDGSLDPEDTEVFRRIGDRLDEEGFPGE
jgi:hypothetical protein